MLCVYGIIKLIQKTKSKNQTMRIPIEDKARIIGYYQSDIKDRQEENMIIDGLSIESGIPIEEIIKYQFILDCLIISFSDSGMLKITKAFIIS
jgi:hypothetical protein